MTDVITTERLNLRPCRLSDAASITELVSDARIYRNVARIPPAQTLAQTEAFLSSSLEGMAAGRNFALAVELDSALVGLVGSGDGGGPVSMPGTADVGYWFAPSVWGRGVATEAMLSFLVWLQRARGYRFFTAGYFVDNPASGRVLRKLDFMPAGRTAIPCLGRGSKVETIEMVRISDAM